MSPALLRQLTKGTHRVHRTSRCHVKHCFSPSADVDRRAIWESTDSLVAIFCTCSILYEYLAIRREHELAGYAPVKPTMTFEVGLHKTVN